MKTVVPLTFLLLLMAMSPTSDWTQPALAADAKRVATFADVPYGEHERQVLDVYTVKSPQPTPWVFYVHGGGWQAGDKDAVHGFGVGELLDSGIAVVAIRYRFVPEAQAAGVRYPLEWPTHDARRALQFARTKAAEWNLDPTRVGAAGGSAGAVTSLWLGLHDDMAEANSSDPIARQSTRLTCVAVSGAQTSLDPKQFREWVPNTSYGAPAFGFPQVPGVKPSSFYQYLAARDQLLPVIREYSAYDLVSADDPPILLEYFSRGRLGEPAEDSAHVDVHGLQFVERAKEVGAHAQVVYPSEAKPKFSQSHDFLRLHLKR
jgi:acetyl esterase/lipase